VTKLLHYYVLGLILLFVLIPMSSTAAEEPVQRLDPSLRMLVLESLQLPEAQMSVQNLLDGGPTGLTWTSKAQEQKIELLVKLDRRFMGTNLHGMRVKVSTGSIIGISATVQQILTLLEDKDIVYIEQSRRTSPTLDRSIPAITADIVHSASPSITGAGVVIGAADTGIDYTRSIFWDIRY